jgi:hypothetical protein
MLQTEQLFEIHNMCVDPKYRKMGLGILLLRRTFDLIYNNYPAYKIWLGVDFDNINAIKLYLKAGFESPKFTDTTPSGYTQDPFLSLIHNRGFGNPNITSLVNFMTKTHVYLTTQLYKVVSFSQADLLFIRKYLLEATEVSGAIKIKNNKVVLQNSNKWLKGVAGVYNVNIPVDISDIQFHTHPLVAYFDTKFVVGFPSHQDFVLLISNFHKISYHFIVAWEGVYKIEMTPQFRIFLGYTYFNVPPHQWKSFIDGFTNMLQTTYFRTSENMLRQIFGPYFRAIADKFENELKVNSRYISLANKRTGVKELQNIKEGYLSKILDLRMFMDQATINHVLKTAHYNIGELNNIKINSIRQQNQMVDQIFGMFTDFNLDFPLFNAEFIECWNSNQSEFKISTFDFPITFFQ